MKYAEYDTRCCQAVNLFIFCKHASENGYYILCTAILGILGGGCLFKVVRYYYDDKYMHEIFKQISNKSLVASFIVLFSETTMTQTIAGWGGDDTY